MLLPWLLLALSLDTPRGVTGFDVTNTRRSVSDTTALFAAKKGKTNSKQRNKPTTASGFGTTGTTSRVVVAVVNDDYAVFPALEERVRDTLVTASDGGMSTEIYQRLDQIYDFPAFNYKSLTEDTTDESSMSLGDMLATSSSSPLDDWLKPAGGASELDSLLALTAGGKASSLVARTASVDHSSDFSRLPPFDKIRVLHIDPLVLAIDDFFTDEECDRYVKASEPKTNSHVLQSRSPTVGKDAAAKAQRTSTTFYHKYQQVPELICKASRLLGVETVDRWEEPQTVRYRRNEKFTWHLDALGPMEKQASSAGQRIVTLLVYLTTLQAGEGGATIFRDLGRGGDGNDKYLRVQPTKGMALLFFPAAGGIPDCPFDIRTLHSGEVVAADAVNDKWIAQLWLRQSTYPPTAPPGNRHADAADAIADYCHRQAAAK